VCHRLFGEQHDAVQPHGLLDRPCLKWTATRCVRKIAGLRPSRLELAFIDTDGIAASPVSYSRE